jgi:hypothetical protein
VHPVPTRMVGGHTKPRDARNCRVTFFGTPSRADMQEDTAANGAGKAWAPIFDVFAAVQDEVPSGRPKTHRFHGERS